MQSGGDRAGVEVGIAVVDRVIGALNDHDLEAFVACYARDAKVEDGYGEVLAEGADGLRLRYGAMFARYPEVRWQVLARIRAGDFVVQHEEVAGRGELSRHVCVYLLRENLITQERVLF